VNHAGMLTWNVKGSTVRSTKISMQHQYTAEKDLIIIPFQIIVPFSPQRTPGKCQNENMDNACIMPNLKPNFINAYRWHN
jgi:hypothetical protein